MQADRLILHVIGAYLLHWGVIDKVEQSFSYLRWSPSYPSNS
jgi:hypothetical protein